MNSLCFLRYFAISKKLSESVLFHVDEITDGDIMHSVDRTSRTTNNNVARKAEEKLR